MFFEKGKNEKQNKKTPNCTSYVQALNTPRTPRTGVIARGVKVYFIAMQNWGFVRRSRAKTLHKNARLAMS